MKTKLLLYSIFLLLAGLFAGYFIFSSADGPRPGDDTSVLYSCAMHPQIIQAEAGICPLCSMDLTPKQNQQQSADQFQLEMSPEAVRLSNINTSPVTTSTNPTKEVAVEGLIAIDESRVAVQTGHLPGRIEDLYVNTTGAYIRKGQALASVYSKELIAVVEVFAAKNSSASVVRSARNNLKSWKIDESQLNNFDTKGDYRKPVDIYADVEGLVIKKLVNVGDHLSAGHMGSPTAMFELADLSKVWVVFDVFAKDLPYIRVGNSVNFQIKPLGTKTYKAVIEYIDPLVNSHNNTVKVRASVNNPRAKVRPGMQVEGKILVYPGSGTKQLVIPKTAVLWTGEKSVVYIKDPMVSIPTFEYRQVVVGTELSKDQIVISEGLEEGELVVTHGAFRVDAVAQLNGKTSMMYQHAKVRPLSFRKTEQQLENIALSKLQQQQVEQFVASYFELKNHLVASEEIPSAKLWEQMQSLIEDIATLSIPGFSSHTSQLDKLLKKARHEKELKSQRQLFYQLSELITPLLSLSNHPVIYQQFCPMAFEGKGAYWYSEERQIANPYFGDKMLHCGFLQDSLVFH